MLIEHQHQLECWLRGLLQQVLGGPSRLQEQVVDDVFVGMVGSGMEPKWTSVLLDQKLILDLAEMR